MPYQTWKLSKTSAMHTSDSGNRKIKVIAMLKAEMMLGRWR
jgi:hypothetical protein